MTSTFLFNECEAVNFACPCKVTVGSKTYVVPPSAANCASDLTAYAIRSAMIVEASDVVLDLNHLSLTYTGPQLSSGQVRAIFVNNNVNNGGFGEGTLTVKNGSIVSGYGTGIRQEIGDNGENTQINVENMLFSSDRNGFGIGIITLGGNGGSISINQCTFELQKVFSVSGTSVSVTNTEFHIGGRLPGYANDINGGDISVSETLDVRNNKFVYNGEQAQSLVYGILVVPGSGAVSLPIPEMMVTNNCFLGAADGSTAVPTPNTVGVAFFDFDDSNPPYTVQKNIFTQLERGISNGYYLEIPNLFATENVDIASNCFEGNSIGIRTFSASDQVNAYLIQNDFTNNILADIQDGMNNSNNLFAANDGGSTDSCNICTLEYVGFNNAPPDIDDSSSSSSSSDSSSKTSSSNGKRNKDKSGSSSSSSDSTSKSSSSKGKGPGRNKVRRRKHEHA